MYRVPSKACVIRDPEGMARLAMQLSDMLQVERAARVKALEQVCAGLLRNVLEPNRGGPCDGVKTAGDEGSEVPETRPHRALWTVGETSNVILRETGSHLNRE